MHLNQMHPLKAPGPDGLPALFFHKFWSTIGDDVSHFVLNVLNNGADPSIFNHTHVVLIPKNKHPQSPKDYHPISLCNVIFKIITKVIANRLKRVLPDIIHGSHEKEILKLKKILITDKFHSCF